MEFLLLVLVRNMRMSFIGLVLHEGWCLGMDGMDGNWNSEFRTSLYF